MKKKIEEFFLNKIRIKNFLTKNEQRSFQENLSNKLKKTLYKNSEQKGFEKKKNQKRKFEFFLKKLEKKVIHKFFQ
jgi:hypothetical protein